MEISLKSFAKIVLCKAINAPTEHIMSLKYHGMSVNRLMDMDYKLTCWLVPVIFHQVMIFHLQHID